MSTYSEIRGLVEPFDIFLFSGRGLISKGIQTITGSPWSHVALALRLPQFDLNLLYESTTLSDLPDLTTGAPVKGVQLVYLSERLRSYEGKVAWRPIRGPKTDFMITQAAKFVRCFQGKPYEQNQLELLFSAIDLGFDIGNRGEDTSSVFCSEVAALLLRKVGILLPDDDKPANEFTPADYAGKMQLRSGYELGDLIPLETRST